MFINILRRCNTGSIDTLKHQSKEFKLIDYEENPLFDDCFGAIGSLQV